MRVLFCTDGSDISTYSLENISNYVDKATVDIICVIDWSFLPESMNMESANYTQAYESIADSVLVFAESMVKDKGYEVGNKIKTCGSAVEGILEQLEEEEYDLILLGSHGKKGLQKWLGSVSRQVVSNTNLPVYISKMKTNGKKILLTVDGSENAYDAVKQSVKLLNLKEKEIHIISAMEDSELLEAALDKNWLDNIEKQQKIHATNAITRVKNLLDKSEIVIKNEMILTGNPAQKIIEFASANEIDLVIMGARSKKDLTSFLLGSVSKRVLENVHCDVLIIKE